MGKKDYYNIKKNLDKVLMDRHTNFLDVGMLKKVEEKLKGIKYNIFYPYNECEKVIIYTSNLPKVSLLEIISDDKLTHRQILGSLFALNIDSGLFGDIIIFNDHYYVLIMDNIYDFIINEFNMVGPHFIKLKKVSFEVLNDYKRGYEEINLIVSSIRIDNVISKLILLSRTDVKRKFYNDEVIINYEICHKLNYNLCKYDIFSIRKYGKYKFMGIIKNTKKNNYIIKILKYI